MTVFRQPRARIARIAAAGSLLLATGIAVVQPAAQWANYAIAVADEATVVPSVGGVRYIDDFAVSPDGTTLYVSRGNLDDVAAFNLETHQELWVSPVDGIHADHMALSPDGSQVVVSATTAQDADVYE